MEVELYVYDLSKGVARQMSASFLGIQIDAVYHTSLVFGGVEYFYGQGVQACYPGGSHHGSPMEIIPMGTTSLPEEVISEYLESLKVIYTPEAYDLFLHNCNNFSNDFAMFLVGRGIPEHITSLPQTVLNTPFGQMLKPQLDSAMRSVTQAPVPPQAIPASHSARSSRTTAATTTSKLAQSSGPQSQSKPGIVHNITSLPSLQTLLESASNSCAVVFFTSSTCAPCKIVYPAYESMAAEYGSKATLIKVDINQAYEISSKYGIRATPTFMTFLKGNKENEWSGANESQLRGNVRLLVQMAFPPHPHTQLRLPKFLHTSLQPITYAKLPPLDKLTAKMGDSATKPAIQGMLHFLRTLHASGSAGGARESPLPDLPGFASHLRSSLSRLPSTLSFPLVDLLRISLADPRVSGFFAEEQDFSTLLALINSSTDDLKPREKDACNDSSQSGTKAIHLLTLQSLCNTFSTPLFPSQLLTNTILSSSILNLTTSSLLSDTTAHVRAASAALAYNLALAVHKHRLESPDSDHSPTDADQLTTEEAQLPLVASILEALATYASTDPETTIEAPKPETLKVLVLALGRLVYLAPQDGEIYDLCRALDAAETVSGIASKLTAKEDVWVPREVGEELLGRGLKAP
ncbi:MAG: hypothetical protein M1819_000323 [Sarea resinae]|nr:MAG: hypothetical protein M1819_000323 [Sarea resinae]